MTLNFVPRLAILNTEHVFGRVCLAETSVIIIKISAK